MSYSPLLPSPFPPLYIFISSRETPIIDKMKMGAIMGASVGLTMGFLFGSYSVLRYGPGPRGYLMTVGQYMMTSGVSFAFFLSIGSTLRNDEADLRSRNMQRRLLAAKTCADFDRFKDNYK